LGKICEEDRRLPRLTDGKRKYVQGTFFPATGGSFARKTSINWFSETIRVVSVIFFNNKRRRGRTLVWEEKKRDQTINRLTNSGKLKRNRKEK